MEGIDINHLMELIGSVVGGGMAVYAGIRADLAALKSRVANVEDSVDRAHRRIDDIGSDGAHEHRRASDAISAKPS